MGNAFITRKSGGSSKMVNAIIEKYKAFAGTISPGTFVEFVENDMSAWAGTESDSTSSAPKSFDVCILSDTTCLLVSSEGTRYYAYAYLLTFDTEAMTVTKTTYKSLNSSDAPVLITRIDDTKALFIGESGSQAYAEVLSVSGTTITEGSKCNLVDSVLDFNSSITCAKCDDGRLLVAGSYERSFEYTLLTITGTKITTSGLSKITLDTYYPAYSPELINIGDNKFLLTCAEESPSGSERSAMLLLSLSETTVTILDTLVLGTIYTMSPIKVAVMPNNRFCFTLDSHNLSKYYTNVFLVELQGNSLSLIDVYQELTSYNGENMELSVGQAVYFGGFIYCQNSMGVAAFEVVDNTIKLKGEFPYETKPSTASAMYIRMREIPNSNYCLVTRREYTSENVVVGQLLKLSEAVIKVKPYETKIDGVTKTKCTENTFGDVWVPYVD